MESKQCSKCGEVKPIGSFPKRYGRSMHLRENICGMCKKRRHIAKDPDRARDQKRVEQYRALAREKGISLEEYLEIRAEKEHRKLNPPIKVRKNLKTRCPLLSANPKILYVINREYYLTKSRRWSRENPAKALIKKQRRRARLAEVESTLTLSEWRGILERFGDRCAYCGASEIKLTQDHVIPISKGGPHTVSNVVPACWSCNSSKGVGPPPAMVQSLQWR